MPRKPLADKGVQTSLRLPRDLYDKLNAAAGDKGIGEEIRRRLEASLFGSHLVIKDERVGELLDTIAQAAAAATKAANAAPFSPYVGFVQAVLMLIAVFQPENAPPVAPEDRWQGAAFAAVALNEMKLADRLGRLMEIASSARKNEVGEP